MKKILKAILFDHDGTLVDSESIHYLHWKRIMKMYSVDFPLELYIKSFTGVPSHQNALDLIEKYNLEADPYKLTSVKAEMSEKSLLEKEYQLMAYTLETVNYFLSKDIKMCVVSGSLHKEVKQSLKNHSLFECFEFIVGGDDVKKTKPAPDVYIKALNDLNLNAEYCIAIEDTASGINAAKGAGLICAAVKSEYSSTQDFSKADVVLNNLREARNWITDNYFL